MMNLSISKCFVQYRFGCACVKREMKKLSVENFVCIVSMKFEDETVGIVWS